MSKISASYARRAQDLTDHDAMKGNAIWSWLPWAIGEMCATVGASDREMYHRIRREFASIRKLPAHLDLHAQIPGVGLVSLRLDEPHAIYSVIVAHRAAVDPTESAYRDWLAKELESCVVANDRRIFPVEGLRVFPFALTGATVERAAVA